MNIKIGGLGMPGRIVMLAVHFNAFVFRIWRAAKDVDPTVRIVEPALDSTLQMSAAP